ncbi:MAG: site-specific DNA-methyltransferase [Elusimicrobiota bacterium]|nr:site-specific DNA-methyltransferase [Elusimicrobiota bacterium]
MSEIPNDVIGVIVTSPPYYNVKDYSKDGYQKQKHSKSDFADIGSAQSVKEYLAALLPVWQECWRILKPNGKMCVNVPLMPLLKKHSDTHYNRDIIDLQSRIQTSILDGSKFFLLDLYIWNRTNASKKLMFGSYPYPPNFYAQNTCEFITVFVKDGAPDKKIPQKIKKESQLTQKEWITYTKQIWDIPIPSKSDLAFGKHPAIMPEEIARRCIKLFSFKQDVVCDPFAGSGTTLKAAKDLDRNFVGYELYENYKKVIDLKLGKESNSLFAGFND